MSFFEKLSYKTTTFISLGSACDVAFFLDEMKLRSRSFPFDWLWNHYSGLEFVSKSLKNKFQNLMIPENYQISTHYRFPYPVVTYKTDSKVAHLHSNPLVNIEDHLILVKRYNRLIKELFSNSFKNFIYYRKFPEDTLIGLTYHLEESFERIIAESEIFIDALLKEFPDIKSRFHLLLIVQVEPKQIKSAKLLLDKFRGKSKLNSSITLEVGVTRNIDDNHHLELWSSEFRRVLLKQKKIPIILKLKITGLSIIKQIKKMKLSLKIWLIKKFLKVANKLPFFD